MSKSANHKLIKNPLKIPKVLTQFLHAGGLEMGGKNLPSLDCKTVGFFFSKSVKKSVKRGVRVLRARSARASHALRACEARGKKRLSPVSLSVFSLVPDLLFDCSRALEYAKIRTVLPSPSPVISTTPMRSSSFALRFIYWVFNSLILVFAHNKKSE